MAHWAELDKDNKVIRVTVGDNNDPAGDEGYSWLIENLGGTWIQTSYNATIRGKYAAVGNVYNPDLDIFELSPEQKSEQAADEKAVADKATARAALLAKLGLTEEETQLLLS